MPTWKSTYVLFLCPSISVCITFSRSVSTVMFLFVFYESYLIFLNLLCPDFEACPDLDNCPEHGK